MSNEYPTHCERCKARLTWVEDNRCTPCESMVKCAECGCAVPECSNCTNLCADCADELEAEQAREYRYWAEIDRRIDESRGK